MNSDEQFYKKIGKSVIIELYNMNVIRFPYQNTLSTRVKQIRNPQKEISGGFLFTQINLLIRCKKL
jgi:hypothetical protein